MENKLNVGQAILAKGCITQLKFLLHSGSLSELEKLLGYRSGRFSKGIAVGNLMKIPTAKEFDFPYLHSLLALSQGTIKQNNHKAQIKIKQQSSKHKHP